jgi:choline dehydrogenase
MERGRERLRIRDMNEEEFGPWAAAVLDAGMELGLPVAGFNDHSHPEVAARLRLNVVDGVRWNTAFAYLDEARGRPNLTIIDHALVDRLNLRGDRVTDAVVGTTDGELRLSGDKVILTAGSYGSPAVLLRSGIGLPGIGANLTDHFGASITFELSETASRELSALAERDLVYGGGTILRAASSRCADGAWDLHLLTWCSAGVQTPTPGRWGARISAYAMKPASRGRLTLRSQDPELPPNVEFGFLDDDTDREVLVDGFERIRRLAATPPLRAVIEREIEPGENASTRVELAAFADRAVRGYFHPVGTCRLGAADDPDAVVDPDARVRGCDNLFVADASIMPTIPRANTNLTVIAIAERVAERLARGGS